MNNKELGEFISSENFKDSSNSLVQRTEEIIGAGADIVSTVFTGLPSYSILKPFIDSLRDWKSRVELKQLAYFLKEFENLNQSERSEFSLMIQANEEDFTERLFYYISQLNDKKKAALCGKLGIAYARKKIDCATFFRLIQIIQKSMYSDLFDLNKKIIDGITDSNDRFNFNDMTLFCSSSGFTHFFNKEDKNFISELVTMGLATQDINTDVLSRSVSSHRIQGVKLEPIAKALKEFKVRHRLTEPAYYLYWEGLSKI